ncbi:MAG: cation:proton antiporter [Candidatus Thermoplasmatota archaeon]|jgi:Kef-type K+ transport system membrane component KefB|nr:cation:proton antiporter [Candidatus Thermoplasmatota archaeon]
MLLEITLAIVFAKLLNLLFEKLKQPGVIGEILAGILLGPCCIGSLSGSIMLFGSSLFHFSLNLRSPEFKEIAFIGVIFLLFMVGLETNMSDLKKTKKAGFFVGIFGVVVPFIFGCIFGLTFGLNVTQSMALGAIFLATSATIAIRILADADMFTTRVGLAIHTAVVINDILAIIIFALVFSNGNPVTLVFQVISFFVLALLLGFIIVRHSSKNNVKRKAPIIILTTGLIICFFFAAFAENMGLTAIIGAFIAGLFIRKTPQANVLADYIKTIGYAFFIPLFFVYVGASFDFIYLLSVQSQQLIGLILFITFFVVFALLGNFFGGFIGAKLSGLTRKESVSVGIGMMPVMGVALIIVTTEIDKGIFGDPTGILAEQVKIATLLLIITSALITPPLLKRSMVSTLLKSIGKRKTKSLFYPYPHCSICNYPLRLIPNKDGWYCDSCKMFIPVQTKNPPNIRHQTIHVNDRYIKYIIGAITILICGFAIQNLPLNQKIVAMIGIFIGTTLAFLTTKYLFSQNKKPDF